jgi:mRNA interferase RelE/StbE
MPWTIQYSKQAERELNKLDPAVQTRIRSFMEDRVAFRDEPRSLAKTLSGDYESLIRYRVGDYRVVCEIHQHVLVVTVIAVAHRREVYRRISGTA